MQGGTGDADLYVKWGEAPTSSIDCGSESSSNNETRTLVARAGTYYVRIAGFTAFRARRSPVLPSKSATKLDAP